MLYDLPGYVITQLGVGDAILGLLKRVVSKSSALHY